MTALDTRLRATAESLIARYGKAMTLRQSAQGTYDASTGEAALTATDHAVTGVMSAPSRLMFASGLAQAGDLAALVAAKALTVVPAPGDQIIMDSETRRVLAVSATYSGEQVAVYELLTRG